jgi:hypothetical protein
MLNTGVKRSFRVVWSRLHSTFSYPTPASGENKSNKFTYYYPKFAFL